jgi:hypothetical protein
MHLQYSTRKPKIPVLEGNPRRFLNPGSGKRMFFHDYMHSESGHDISARTSISLADDSAGLAAQRQDQSEEAHLRD